MLKKFNSKYGWLLQEIYWYISYSNMKLRVRYDYFQGYANNGIF